MILSNGFVQGELARGEVDRTEALVAMIRAGWGIPGSGFMQAGGGTVFMPRSTPHGTGKPWSRRSRPRRHRMWPPISGAMIAGIDVTGILDKVTCPVLVSHRDG